MTGEVGTEETLVVDGESLTTTLDSAPLSGDDATVSADLRPRGAALSPVGPGATVGRYVVLSQLGAGAMGVVLAAYDPELDRKVAVKMLQARDSDSDAGRARLQREAQSLAKLDHTNVVAVHDVGVHAGQVFVAMEFVAGQTLTAWLEAEPRSWREVVSVFVDAGRGLAAAHRAGLVHRDFKPDNVMIGDDRRVRVMDFGLARTEAGADTNQGDNVLPANAGLLDRSSSSEPSLRLTRTGALLGTPAYMAPEQFRGLPADALSDQFSYCVSLYKALYGEPPFPAKTIHALVAALAHATPPSPPERAVVPGWVYKVMARGLARDPAARHESMDALLDRLVADPIGRRRRLGVALGLGAVVVFGAWGVGRHERGAEPPQVCAGMDTKLVDVWDDARRHAMERSMLATDLSYASDTWARVEQGLDAFAERWTTQRTEACLATQRGEQSAELLDRRMGCLDRHLGEFGAVVEVLVDADAGVVERAASAVAGLPSLERCADIEALTAAIPPPDDADVAARVTALDQQLDRAAAMKLAHRTDAGLELADAAVEEASALDYPPIHTRALLIQGYLREQHGDHDAAVASLRRAYVESVRAKMLPRAAKASTRLTFVYANHSRQPDEAKAWGVHAEAFAAAVGIDAEAEFLAVAGTLDLTLGDLDAAKADLGAAIALLEGAADRNSLTLATAYNDLGIASAMAEDYVAAQSQLQRALAIRMEALGPKHPEVGRTLANLANLADLTGEHEQAVELFERARANLEQALGSTHPSLAVLYDDYGVMLVEMGEGERAQTMLERALELNTASDPDHPRSAYSLVGLATLAKERGELELAAELFERALAVEEAAYGPEHAGLVDALFGLGRARLDQGHTDEAAEALQRGLAIHETAGGGPTRLAELRFALARALASSDPRRARELAAAAREHYASVDDIDALAEVDAWLVDPARGPK